MQYAYRAVNSEGGVVSGSVMAADIRSAGRSLRSQGLNVISLDEERVQGAAGRHSLRKPSTKDIMIFLQQLCVLLQSDVPLAEAMESLATSVDHQFLQKKCLVMTSALRGGTSFTDALAATEIKVPRYFFPLVRAGEATGQLGQALRDSLSQWEYEQKTRQQLLHLLTYPTILVVTGIGSVLLIFLTVVPKFIAILEKTKADLPLLSKIVLGAGKYFNAHVVLILLTLAGLVALCWYVMAQKKLRQKLWDGLGTLPLLREWMQGADIGRWASMLATLLDNRVEFVSALDLARHNVNLSLMSARLAYATKAVRGGTSLAQALSNAQAVNATGCNLIRIGEKTGRLPAMLRSLAAICEEDVKNRTQRLLSLVEPAAIILIGAAVGLIMGGIILAITSMSDIKL